MKEYEKLSISQKAKLLDKLVTHAEHIRDNFFVMIQPSSDMVKDAITNAEYFLRVLAKELNAKSTKEALNSQETSSETTSEKKAFINTEQSPDTIPQEMKKLWDKDYSKTNKEVKE